MRYSVTLPRFDGGLNTKATPLHGDPDQSPDSQNVIYDDEGAVQTSRGRTRFNSSAIATASIDLLHSYVNNSGTAQLMAACNGNLYRASGNTFVAVASATSVFTKNVGIFAVTFQNKMFMTDGYVNPYKWNGTEFTRMGVPTQENTTTAATGGAGLLSGTYNYAVLGVNSYSVKGDYGTACASIAVVSSQINLTGIPVWPTSAGVNEKYICRNTAGVSNVFYLVTAVTNGITSFVDNTADSSLTTLAPVDNGLPQYFTTMIPHMGRMWGASKTSSNPMYLHYSNADDPEIWGSEDYVRIGEGDGLPIVGLATLANAILIAKDDGTGNGSMYVLSTPDNNSINWRVIQLDTQSGSQSAKVMTKFANSVAYLNRNGVYDISELAVGDIKSDALSYNIESEIYTLAKNYLSKATAITWKNKVWISVPYGSTQPTNNRILQYDFVRGRRTEQRELGAWSRFTDMSISDMVVHDGNLYGGAADDTGFVYQLDTGYNNDGAAIDSYFKTMAIVGKPEHEGYTKVWRYAYLTVECTGDWFMNINYLKDFNEEAGNAIQINLDPAGAEWGTAIIGVDKYGVAIERKKVRINFTNAVSKVLQLKFSTNAVDQYFKVHNAEIFYNLKGLRS